MGVLSCEMDVATIRRMVQERILWDAAFLAPKSIGGGNGEHAPDSSGDVGERVSLEE